MSLIWKLSFILVFYSTLHHTFIKEISQNFNPAGIKKDSIIQRRTAIIDGTRYTAIKVLIDDSVSKFQIKDIRGKIVYTYEKGYMLSFKFRDFNGDGYKDVILELRGVDSGGQDLVIYDAKSKRFKLAGDCSNAEKIPKTKYYYTYEDCCMGRNWSSDLFYIADSKIINIGHIKYDDGDGLSFYKLDGERQTFLKKWRVRINGDTPVTTGRHIDFDLGQYWAKHWKLFSN